MKLIFDIETVGVDFESLSESQREYLLRYADKERDEELRELKRDEAIRYLSLYPFTAKVAVIAFLNVETEKTVVIYEAEETEEWIADEKGIKYKSASEIEIIKTFWNYAEKSDQLISFNGRQFDIPFLMLRSAMLKVRPSKNFLKNRFESKDHIDLLDKFTFTGLTRKFNLDFYCHAFGLESPKSKGISGMEVKDLYNAGKIKELAIYCADDVRATYDLYKIWNSFLNL